MSASLLNNRRIRTLAAALFQRRADSSYEHLAYNVFCPASGWLARKAIAREERQDQFLVVYLRGHSSPLYFPAEMDRSFLHQAIAEALPKAWHQYETPETTVRPTDVVIDCGTAEGLFALNVVQRCARLICFEPLPAFVRALRRTFAPFPTAQIVAKALGDAEGTAYLREDGMMSSLSQEENGVEVAVDSLDNYCAQTGARPTYLKADLEGHEIKMLRGARDTIHALKPRIAITTYHRPGDAREIKAFLHSVNPAYQFRLRGLEYRTGEPMLLHAW